MAALLKLITALPGAIVAFKGILDVFVRYFPPKEEAVRAVDKMQEKLTKAREAQLVANKQIKEAKLGKTKAIEAILNRPV